MPVLLDRRFHPGHLGLSGLVHPAPQPLAPADTSVLAGGRISHQPIGFAVYLGVVAL